MDRDTTKFTVPDLKEGLEYYFRVTALNDEGESKPLESVDTAKPKKKIGEASFVGNDVMERKLSHYIHVIDRHQILCRGQRSCQSTSPCATDNSRMLCPRSFKFGK